MIGELETEWGEFLKDYPALTGRAAAEEEWRTRLVRALGPMFEDGGDALRG